MGLATRKVLALVDICSLVSSSILFTQLGRRKRYKGYSFESSTCAGQMEVNHLKHSHKRPQQHNLGKELRLRIYVSTSACTPSIFGSHRLEASTVWYVIFSLIKHFISQPLNFCYLYHW